MKTLQQTTRRRTAAISVAIGLLTASGIAWAQSAAERAVDTRQSVLTVMGWNMAPLGAMARGKMDFDQAVVAQNAERIAWMATMLSDAFAMDTRGSGAESNALDGIWEDPEDFAEKVAASEAAAKALVEAAAGDDVGAMRQAIGGLGRTCGGCHDAYKAD
ncbi:MAG: cytochrome c [Pseudomonadota bacterium]